MSTVHHRTYTLDFKAKAVARLNGGENATLIAKDLKIAPSMVYQWRLAINRGGSTTRPKKKGKPAKLILSAGTGSIGPVVGYLKHARDTIEADLRSGKIKHFDRSQLLTMLAFTELTGD